MTSDQMQTKDYPEKAMLDAAKFNNYDGGNFDFKGEDFSPTLTQEPRLKAMKEYG